MRVTAAESQSPTKKEKDPKWNEDFSAKGTEKAWKDLNGQEKVELVFMICLKLSMLFFIIFSFLLTLALLSKSFDLLAGRGLGNTIKNSPFLQNPITSTIIGMLISSVLQSSSTLISLLVGMVSGQILTVHQAIPIMIGAELGSSLMNVLVSIGQVGNREHFRRAFACATMNDAFNVMNYLTVLPLEITLAPLERISGMIVQPLSHVHTKEFKTIQLLTEPILDKVVQIDSAAITRVSAISASGNKTALSMIDRKTFIYRCIDMETYETLPFCPYNHIFANSVLSDSTIGIILLAVSIGMLVLCLFGIVKIIQSLLGGRFAATLNKIITYDLPHPFKFLTGYMIIIFGALVVVIVESSSVFRSALTPLVGIGVIPLERYYALVIGSNVGTTSTGILAALASDPSQLQETLQIALCQTLYNLFGIIFFYPIPFLRRIPLRIAMTLGDKTAKYRWFSLVYVALVFFIMPSTLLLLSLLPSLLMLIIIGVIVTFLATIFIINWFQSSFPKLLPKFIRNWDFLPDYLHSLKPYDKMMVTLFQSLPCCPRRFFTPSSTEEIDSDGDSRNLEHSNVNVIYRQTPV